MKCEWCNSPEDVITLREIEEALREILIIRCPWLKDNSSNKEEAE